MKKIFHAGNRCKLSDLLINQKGKIINVLHPNKELRTRLLDMGLTKDAIITIKKVSPLGDPVDIFLRDYELCLRRDDLKYIEIEVIE